MKGNAPERLVSGSDDFTMFLWEPFVNKHPKARMTGHQQVQIFSDVIICLHCNLSSLFSGANITPVSLACLLCLRAID
jgi:hypothetical protein